MGEQWKSGVAITRAATAIEEPTNYHWLLGESANIAEVPIIYERAPTIVPDTDQIHSGGFDCSFNAGGISPHANIMGYLLWLILGGDAYDTGTHTITPADDAQYLNFLIDRQADIDPGAGTSKAQRLIGAKMTKFAFELSQNDNVKLDIEGIGCKMGTPVAALVPVIPTGEDNEPLAWHHALTPGYFEVGLNDVAPTEDNEITHVKFEIQRPAKGIGRNLGSPQPTAIVGGRRRVTWEFTKEFTGARAIEEYASFRNSEELAIYLSLAVGDYSIEVQIPCSKFTAGPLSEVGNKEDVQESVFSGVARKKDTNHVIRAFVKDGTTALYT